MNIKNYKNYKTQLRLKNININLIYFKVAIDNLEFCCMDPDMECHYKELLHQWKNDEDTVKDELKELGADVKEIGTNVKEFGTDIKEFGTDIEEIGGNIKECDRGIREVGTDVKEIGTDVKRFSKKLDDLMASNVTPANGAGKCVGN